MIRIKKSKVAPQVLKRRGEPATVDLKKEYELDPGIASFDFNSSIYGDSTVKNALKDDQHGKCCFCEADFSATGFGDVEHFRPKGGYQSVDGGPLHRPGYYWLAYSWTNLLFSCEVCNRKYKKNYFPLMDESGRAKNHHDPIEDERPLLIDPTVDDPEQHLRYEDEMIYALDERGRISIRVFGLNREEIIERRAAHLVRLKLFHRFILSTGDDVSNDLADCVVEAKEILEDAVNEKSPFAAMVRCKWPELYRGD